MGSKGSAMITDKHYIMVPVASGINHKIGNDFKIIDTVGAGDCFTAAFAVKHSELNWSKEENYSENYRKAMVFGNSSAFLCITQKGAMPSMPNRDQVDKFMEKYGIL